MPAEREFEPIGCLLPGMIAVAAHSARAFGRHTHDEYGIGLIAAGAQRSASGRGPVEAGAGDVITVNPGEVHDGAPIGGARAWRMLYFEPALAARALDDIAAEHPVGAEFTAPAIRHTAIRTRFLSLYEAMTARDGDAARLRGDEAFLALIADLFVTRQAPSSNGAEAAIRIARQRIDDDPAAPISLAELARLTGLSRFQVLRAFARATGFTPHAYLMQRRLHLARRLVSAGQPLAAAALDSGFADQSHMTRAFARAFGYSPGTLAAASSRHTEGR